MKYSDFQKIIKTKYTDKVNTNEFFRAYLLMSQLTDFSILNFKKSLTFESINAYRLKVFDELIKISLQVIKLNLLSIKINLHIQLQFRLSIFQVIILLQYGVSIFIQKIFKNI